MAFGDKLFDGAARALAYTYPIYQAVSHPLKAIGSLGSGLARGVSDTVGNAVETKKNVVSDVKDTLNSSNINLDSLGDALSNSMSSYTSSALEFEKQAVKDLQDFNAHQAELAFERSQSSAREQMDFQRSEREAAQAYNTLMSNTQYQRAVADLKAAGINPIMAVHGFSGSAPTISAMSGASAGSSPASSSKADYSSALSEDKKAIDAILGLLNSSINLFKIFKH